jgi:hypothetical protein
MNVRFEGNADMAIALRSKPMETQRLRRDAMVE